MFPCCTLSLSSQYFSSVNHLNESRQQKHGLHKLTPEWCAQYHPAPVGAGRMSVCYFPFLIFAHIFFNPENNNPQFVRTHSEWQGRNCYLVVWKVIPSRVFEKFNLNCARIFNYLQYHYFQEVYYCYKATFLIQMFYIVAQGQEKAVLQWFASWKTAYTVHPYVSNSMRNLMLVM